MTSLWTKNGKVLVDATGKPVYCDYCPCLPEGTGPVSSPCCVDTPVPPILFADVSAVYHHTTDLSCPNPCVNETPSWSEAMVVPLILTQREAPIILGGPGPTRPVWIGKGFYPLVRDTNPPIFYPPYDQSSSPPPYPYPYRACPDGTPFGGWDDPPWDHVGDDPCFYLFKLMYYIEFGIYCETGSHGTPGWKYLVVGGSGGPTGGAGPVINPGEIQCNPFAIVPATPAVLWASPGAYPPGTEELYCGSEHCATGGRIKLFGIFE